MERGVGKRAVRVSPLRGMEGASSYGEGCGETSCASVPTEGCGVRKLLWRGVWGRLRPHFHTVLLKQAIHTAHRADPFFQFIAESHLTVFHSRGTTEALNCRCRALYKIKQMRADDTDNL